MKTGVVDVGGGLRGIYAVGRNYKFYTEYAFRRQYMSIGNFIFKHSFVDMDYLYGTLCRAKR